VATAHTATQQWQSFEIRMRHRRAERCRLRAEVALDAGFLDDAREALDEARRLQPDLEGLADSEQRLAEAQSGRRAASEGGARRRGRVAIAAALPVALGCGWWVIVNDQAPARVSSYRAAADVIAGPRSAVNIPQVIAPAPAAPDDFSTDDASAPAEPAADPAPEPAQRRSEPAPLARTEAGSTANPPVVPPPVPDPPRASTAADTSPIPVPQISTPEERALTPVPPPVPSLPPSAPPAAVGTSGAAAPSAAPEPDPASAVSPEIQVRSVLSRYEAAYSALNAAAARDVWPGVDAASLARAFDSLESQRIDLGSCAISVGGDGRSARATCTGTATWTPKIGGGTTTKARNWAFDLARRGSDWQIVRATVR
jgi:hypothetical protein